MDLGPTAGLDLVWVPADGGEATLISPARGASRPHFADAPDRIYVTTPKGLVSMRYDGTDRRTHLERRRQDRLTRPSEPEPADEILLRPDGRWALARSTNQLYLLAMPAFGGEAPKVAVHEPSVPLKKLTDVGADYAAWTDGGKTIVWAVGASVFRLPFDSVVFTPLKAEEGEKDEEAAKAEKEREKPRPEEIAVVVERPRHRPRGSIVLRGAKVVTMRGDEVIDGGDIVVTDHRIVAVGPEGIGQGARGGEGRSTSPGRRSCPASSTPTPTGPRSAAACSTWATGASSPTSPTA